MTAGHHANGVSPTGSSLGSPVLATPFVGGFFAPVIGYVDVVVVVLLPLLVLITEGRGPPF